MEAHRKRRGLRPILTASAALSLALGHAERGWGQAGSLQQLGRPQACTTENGDGINCTDGVGLDGAYDVKVSPDGKSVYVPSYVSSSVAVFARDAVTGALTQLAAPEGCVADSGDGFTCKDGVGLFGATGVAVSPDSKHVYVASAVSASVTVFTRDLTTGALTQLPAPDGCVAQDGGGTTGCSDAYGPIAPTSVLVSPDGSYVYTAAFNGDTIAVFARNKTTGALTQLPAPAGCIAENGDGITCTDGVALDGPSELTVNQNGRHLYVASGDSNAVAVFKRNKNTGALKQLAAPAGCLAENGNGVTCTDAVGLAGASSVAVGKNGKHVYVASLGSDAVAVFARNTTTGALTQLAAPDGCLAENGDGVTCTDAIALNGARGIGFSKNGRHLYVASGSSAALTVFRRDKTTGVLTQLAAPKGCSSATGDGITCAGGLGLAGVKAVAVTKNGKHLYAVSLSGNAVAAFAREQ